MQRRSRGCSADVPGHEVAASHARLQCQALVAATRTAAAPGVLLGVETKRRSSGCSADVPGHEVVAAHSRLQLRRRFAGRGDEAAQQRLQRR